MNKCVNESALSTTNGIQQVTQCFQIVVLEKNLESPLQGDQTSQS